MTIKVKSLVPSLGFINSPIGTILDVDEKTAERLIAKGKAELLQEKAQKEKDSPKIQQPKKLDGKVLKDMSVIELRAHARELGLNGITRINKTGLIKLIKIKEADG